MILPLIAAAVYYVQFRVSQSVSAQYQQNQNNQMAFIGLLSPIMMGVFSFVMPAALQLYTSVPLASFSPDHSSGKTVKYQSDLHATDRRQRIHLFFESYGTPVPNELCQWIIKRLTTMCDTLRNGAAEGNLAFQKMVDEGHFAHYESEIRFVADHFNDWI